MNPIAVLRSTAPNLCMQQSIYNFIPAVAEKDGGINIIGSLPQWISIANFIRLF